MLTETNLIGFIRCHTATLEEVKIPAVVLNNESAGFTSWEKILKQTAPNLSLAWLQLRWLRSEDIENVVLAGDPGSEACNSRHAAYCQDLT